MEVFKSHYEFSREYVCPSDERGIVSRAEEDTIGDPLPEGLRDSVISMERTPRDELSEGLYFDGSTLVKIVLIGKPRVEGQTYTRLVALDVMPGGNSIPDFLEKRLEKKGFELIN